LWEVILNDMQIEDDIEKIVDDIIKEAPDIIWISVTFWQQKLLEKLLEKLELILNPNQSIVIWWSLAARNYEYILSKYQYAILSLSYWE
jgi:hypothetical protein